MSAALGVASVDGGYAVLAALGGSGVHSWVQRVSGELSLVRRWYCLLAGHTVRTAVRRYRADGQPAESRTEPRAHGPNRAGRAEAGRRAEPGRAYRNLVGLTAMNPATVATFAAVVVGRSRPAPLPGRPRW